MRKIMLPALTLAAVMSVGGVAYTASAEDWSSYSTTHSVTTCLYDTHLANGKVRIKATFTAVADANGESLGHSTFSLEGFGDDASKLKKKVKQTLTFATGRTVTVGRTISSSSWHGTVTAIWASRVRKEHGFTLTGIDRATRDW